MCFISTESRYKQNLRKQNLQWGYGNSNKLFGIWYEYHFAVLCLIVDILSVVTGLLSPTFSWWHHQMETFSALLALCAGNSPVTGELPSQRPVTQSFDVFLYLHLNKQLSKQSWPQWFEMQSCSLWRHCNVLAMLHWHLGLWSVSGKTSYRQILWTLKAARLDVIMILSL